MMDMMKKGAALMGAALLTVTLWSTPVMAAVNVPANLAAVSKTVKGAAPYGVYFSDLKTGKGYYRNSVQTPAASMIKVFILAAAYEDIRDGKLSLTETFTLTDKNVVAGSGVLQGMPKGTTVTVKKALDEMIIHSDNTATNLMIDRLGMDRVNRYLKEHGYKDTTLRRKMMDFDAAKKGAENMTTVRDVGLLFKRLYQGKCVSKDLDAQILAIYKAQVDTDMLPDKLPKGTVVAHKTGEVRDLRHDGGIVYTAKGDYVLVVFTRDYTPYASVADLSRRVYDGYVK